MNRLTVVPAFTLAALLTSHAASENGHSHNASHDHAAMHPDVTLTEAGNDVFGTLQEVIRALNENPNTDWSQVDLEALRQHLLDMRDMTLNVDVIESEALKNGAQWTIQATTKRAQAALTRVLAAHPEQLAHETGWVMTVEHADEKFQIQVTSQHAKDAAKIQGLGYIGIMAYGDHHQPHHWAMANSANPHAGH